MKIISFYFWNAGSEYEKSLRGLYRALLRQILEEFPELMDTVLPLQYGIAMSAPWLTPKAIHMTDQDTVEALSNIIESPSLYKNKCLCLFIDGLDEFEQTVQEDYRDLVGLLRRWATRSPGNVKICVSSREYTYFINAFSETSRIRLHDLTRQDMEIYTRERLAHASGDENLNSLISAMLGKANGIFLWVALVVKSMREGLDNGLSCAILIGQVDSLPDELESLYGHMIDTLDKVARRRAYQTFAMLIELNKYEFRMSLLAYSFLNDYEQKKDLFVDQRDELSIPDLTGEPGRNRMRSSKDMLAGWCKGLVEPYEDHYTSDWGHWNLVLDFTHRTVLEFLNSEVVKAKMNSSLGSFDHVDAISGLLIAHVLFSMGTALSQESHFGAALRLGTTITLLLRMRRDHKLDRAPYTYLNRLQTLLETTEQFDLICPGMSIVILSDCKGSSAGGNELYNYTSKYPANKPRGHAIGTEIYIVDPVHLLCLDESYDYPIWYISNNTTRLSKQPNAVCSLACCCMWARDIWNFQTNNGRIKVVEALLETGLLTPVTIMYCGPFFESVGCKGNDGFGGLNNIWQYFMLGFACHRCSGRMGRRYELGKQVTQSIGNYLELFLRFEPDLELSFSWMRDVESTGVIILICGLGGRSYVFKVNMGNMGTGKAYKTYIKWVSEAKDDSFSPETVQACKRRVYSLREMVKLYRFANEERILQLIDQQLRSRKLELDLRKSPIEQLRRHRTWNPSMTPRGRRTAMPGTMRINPSTPLPLALVLLRVRDSGWL